MAADTVREECDEPTGEYRVNEAREDRDALQLIKELEALTPSKQGVVKRKKVS